MGVRKKPRANPWERTAQIDRRAKEIMLEQRCSFSEAWLMADDEISEENHQENAQCEAAQFTLE